MDCIPNLKLSFRDIRADNSELREDWEILLRIVGRFEVESSRVLLFSEDEFPLVEFGVAAMRWIRSIRERNEDFEFESMDFDGAGLVWIRQHEGRWLIGSVLDQRKEQISFELEEIEEAVSSYWDRLVDAVHEVLGITIPQRIYE